MRLLSSLLLAVSLVACANTSPIDAATRASPENRPEVVAFALHSSFVVVAEAGATIAEDSTVPRAVRKTILEMYERTSPVVRKLRFAAETYRDVKAAVDTTQGSIEKANAALVKLNELINQAAPRVEEFASEVALVKSHTSTGSSP
jgi:hypothetical protein